MEDKTYQKLKPIRKEISATLNMGVDDTKEELIKEAVKKYDLSKKEKKALEELLN